jgi:hypothetical protein
MAIDSPGDNYNDAGFDLGRGDRTPPRYAVFLTMSGGGASRFFVTFRRSPAPKWFPVRAA